MYGTVSSWSHFTRKQANIIYAAIKRGDLVVRRGFAKKLYGIVDLTTMDYEECNFRCMCEEAIPYIIKNQYEYAQAILDGKEVFRKLFVDSVEQFTIENDEQLERVDNIFAEIGDTVCFIHAHEVLTIGTEDERWQNSQYRDSLYEKYSEDSDWYDIVLDGQE